jgi:hypothetical protein
MTLEMARTWNTSEKKQLNVALPKVANKVLPGPKGHAQVIKLHFNLTLVCRNFFLYHHVHFFAANPFH